MQKAQPHNDQAQRKQDRQAEAEGSRVVVHGLAVEAMGLMGPMVPPAAASAFVALPGDTEMDCASNFHPGWPSPKLSTKRGPGHGINGHWCKPGSNVNDKIRDAMLD